MLKMLGVTVQSSVAMDLYTPALSLIERVAQREMKYVRKRRFICFVGEEYWLRVFETEVFEAGISLRMESVA